METSRRIVMCSLVAVSFLLLTFNVGCASIISGTTQHVGFTSHPDQAQIEIISPKGQVIHRVKTPTSLVLKRGRPYFRTAGLTLRAWAEGYEEKQIPIKNRLNGWYFGNIFFGGLIGILIVDPLTGAMYSFPEQIHIDLEETDSTSSALGSSSTEQGAWGQRDRRRSVGHLLVGNRWIVT